MQNCIFNCPKCFAPLQASDASLTCGEHRFPVVKGVARFVGSDGYAQNFSYQWNLYRGTQIDDDKQHQSSDRFWAETGWNPSALERLRILEVGSGAGRFTSVLMRESKAQLLSVDYSEAVDANFINNSEFVRAGRLQLGQADVYRLPIKPSSMDKVFCLGVLQHTPDFRLSLERLYMVLRNGGELVVDFYPIKGWYTKINAKYLLRPLTTRLSPMRLHAIVRKTVPYSLAMYRGLSRAGLGVLTRFIPICGVANLPGDLPHERLVEWCTLDTFDMFSPKYDKPQRIEKVASWLMELGAIVEFAGFIKYHGGNRAAVVRARKPD